MTCWDFFTFWKDVCESKKYEIIEAWETDKWQKYTDVILGKSNNSSVLVDINDRIKKREKGFDFYQEYYSCDAVFYKENDMINKNDIIKLWKSNTNSNTPPNFNQTWLKKINIHFEHENDIKSSWQEISQFCTMPGILNILVTYPNNEIEKENAVKCYRNILSKTKFKRKLLIIFGHHIKETNYIEWEGYIWCRIKKKFYQIK